MVERPVVRAAIVVLAAAISYNLPLAILNAHAFSVGRNVLIGVEAVLMASGLLLALANWRQEMTRWLLMIAVFALLSMVLSQFRQGFDPKSLRDTLMFAVFIMIGMLTPWADARRAIVAMHVAIVAIMLVEVGFPEFYGALVDTRSFFISSRGFTAEQLGDSILFGSIRPDERYILPWLGWNRASSLFLEPLSLGNYASFAVLAMLMFWRDWSPRMRVFMGVSTLVILVGSDSRFAAISIVILVALAPLLQRLPAVLSIAWLPAGVLVARIISASAGWNPVNDTFTGRIARGMKQLFRLDWYDISGFSVPTPSLGDSGISYLVMSQSLLGVVILQVFLYLQPGMRSPEQRLYLHGTALTFALSILVSISMLSIKTAGFYWFLMGVIIVLAKRDEVRRMASPAGITP